MDRTSHRGSRQRGIALIAVTVSLLILGAIIAEFSTDTTIDYMAAANARDEMQAEFLMRSGVNLTQVIIRLQTDILDKYRKELNNFKITDYAPQFIGAFGGDKEELDAWGDLLGGFRGDMIKGLGVDVGKFDVLITTDDGRINMNCANGSDTTQKTLKTQLEALFYNQAFDPIFQNADAEGWRRDRATQAAALIDYIDRDHAGFGQPGTTEEYGYDTLDDRYKAKNNYLDTIGELKQVRGVDDRFWTLFGDQFTVYGDCKVNIGAVEDPKLISSILFLAAKNPDDPVVKDPMKLWALSRLVIDSRDWVLLDDLESFADFVKDPTGSLGTLFASSAAAGAAGGATPPPQLGNLQVEGLELDPNKLAQVATSGPTRTYRIEVVATVPRGGGGPGAEYVRRLTAVWDTKTQNQNMRDAAYARGSWVYWRVE